MAEATKWSGVDDGRSYQVKFPQNGRWLSGSCWIPSQPQSGYHCQGTLTEWSFPVPTDWQRNQCIGAWCVHRDGDDVKLVWPCSHRPVDKPAHQSVMMVMMLCKSGVSLFSQIGRKPSTQDPLTGMWTCGTCQRTPATMATRMRTWSYGCAPPHCPPSASCIAASTRRTPPSARVCPRAAMRSPSLTVSKPGVVRWCRTCVFRHDLQVSVIAYHERTCSSMFCH